MSHPCDGHPCDHCYLCDVVGICCATVPHGATAPASVLCDQRRRDAVVDSASSGVNLTQLIHETTSEPSLTQLIRDEPVPHGLAELIEAEPPSPAVPSIRVVPGSASRPALPPGPPPLFDSTIPTFSEEVRSEPIARHHF